MGLQIAFLEILFYSMDVRKCMLLWSACNCRDFSNNRLIALPGLQNCWKKLWLSGTHKQHADGQDLHQKVVQIVCFLEPAICDQCHHVLSCHVIKILPLRDKGKITSVSNHHDHNRYMVNNCWYFIFNTSNSKLARKCHKFGSS